MTNRSSGCRSLCKLFGGLNLLLALRFALCGASHPPVIISEGAVSGVFVPLERFNACRSVWRQVDATGNFGPTELFYRNGYGWTFGNTKESEEAISSSHDDCSLISAEYPLDGIEVDSSYIHHSTSPYYSSCVPENVGLEGGVESVAIAGTFRSLMECVTATSGDYGTLDAFFFDDGNCVGFKGSPKKFDVDSATRRRSCVVGFQALPSPNRPVDGGVGIPLYPEKKGLQHCVDFARKHRFDAVAVSDGVEGEECVIWKGGKVHPGLAADDRIRGEERMVFMYLLPDTNIPSRDKDFKLPVVISEGRVDGVFVALERSNEEARVWRAVDTNGHFSDTLLYYLEGGWNIARSSEVMSPGELGYWAVENRGVPPDDMEVTVGGWGSLHHSVPPYYTSCVPRRGAITGEERHSIPGTFTSLMGCVNSSAEYFGAFDAFYFDEGKCYGFRGEVSEIDDEKSATRRYCIIGRQVLPTAYFPLSDEGSMHLRPKGTGLDSCLEFAQETEPSSVAVSWRTRAATDGKIVCQCHAWTGKRTTPGFAFELLDYKNTGHVEYMMYVYRKSWRDPPSTTTSTSTTPRPTDVHSTAVTTSPQTSSSSSSSAPTTSEVQEESTTKNIAHSSTTTTVDPPGVHPLPLSSSSSTPDPIPGSSSSTTSRPNINSPPGVHPLPKTTTTTTTTTTSPISSGGGNGVVIGAATAAAVLGLAATGGGAYWALTKAETPVAPEDGWGIEGDDLAEVDREQAVEDCSQYYK